jgi:hypothetical protein
MKQLVCAEELARATTDYDRQRITAMCSDTGGK